MNTEHNVPNITNIDNNDETSENKKRFPKFLLPTIIVVVLLASITTACILFSQSINSLLLSAGYFPHKFTAQYPIYKELNEIELYLYSDFDASPFSLIAIDVNTDTSTKKTTYSIKNMESSGLKSYNYNYSNNNYSNNNYSNNNIKIDYIIHQSSKHGYVGRSLQPLDFQIISLVIHGDIDDIMFSYNNKSYKPTVFRKNNGYSYAVLDADIQNIPTENLTLDDFKILIK